MISVIVPVYEVAEEYFHKCVESILSQSYKDLQLVLVDDGARKPLPELCEEYAGRDERVLVLHQENKGASAARNAGLNACSGQYVTFVDSDDYIAENTLELAAERIEGDNLQVLLWGSYKCYGSRLEKYMPYSDDIRLFDKDRKRELMYKTLVGYLPFYREPATRFGSGSCCSKLYDRSFLMENGLLYPEGIKRAEDVNFNLRVFDRADRIGYMNRHLYYYRQLQDSATYSYREGGIEVFTSALGAIRDFLEETHKDGEFLQIYYMRCIFFFLESMDMDYFNPNNKKPLGKRLGEMRGALNEEPYREAVENIELKRLSMARRLPVLLMRGGHVLLLGIFYGVYRKIKG